MNPVLDTLCYDHANFAKLLNVIEHQTGAVAAGLGADVDVLAKALAYLEGYPALYHHPLEEALCARLRPARSVTSPDIDDIRRQHGAVRQRLERFKRHLDDLTQDRDGAADAFVTAAGEFVQAEWEHMELERCGLFPAAAAVLGEGDWAGLEEHISSSPDPLFDCEVEGPLELLHRALLECDSKQRTIYALRNVALI